ncbi:putative pyrroloquinoline-quinone binding quinoprotein [Dyadobacter jejuensis]|uniref:Putative pyrroloquinoline-quinone binding quinoprotein n=1 Tax=Dyadobacter jejuensis TaxID=1082580 RepID=A0A316AQR6_9BACT|nr:PQQ-binding-like beta-propeller repeat protein [Dyadobacter jejuensis]PWJ59639.1 putative pyrroloquinoline-quinone binding quinoprotein [Dyadobacter jejuensis]
MSISFRIIYILSFCLLFACKQKEINTQKIDGVVTQLSYIWKSSISSTDRIGADFYRGYVVNGHGVLCSFKSWSNGQGSTRQSYLVLKNVENGKDIWKWDALVNKRFTRPLKNNVVIHKNNLWIHDGYSDYCLNATTGQSVFQFTKDFSTIAGITSIEDQIYFVANGRNANQKEQFADSFYQLNTVGSGFTEMDQPPYNQEYSYYNQSGYYIGSMMNLTAFRHHETDYLVVPYMEMGPPSVVNPAKKTNRTFFGLYNLSDRKWAFDRISISFPDEIVTQSNVPIVYDNSVILSCGPFVYAFELFTGKRKWERRLTNAPTSPIDMLLANNVLIVNMGDALLYGVDVSTGKVLWTQKSSGISSDLYHQNGVVYWIPSKNLRAVDLETGKLLWDMPSIDQVQEPGSESVWWGFVTGIPGKNGEKGKIFATSDHYLYCFEAIR